VRESHIFVSEITSGVSRWSSHLVSNQREQQQRWPGYSFRHQERMWRIGPNQCDSWSSFGNQSQLKQFRQFQALTQFPPSFHIGPKSETLRDTQTSNLAIPGQGEWRGQTLGICRRQRRSYQMCPRWNGQFAVGERITYQDLYSVIIILLKCSIISS